MSFVRNYVLSKFFGCKDSGGSGGIDPNNLLSGLAWHIGEISAEDGTINDTVTVHSYTDVFDISGFIGTMMSANYDCEFPQFSRMAVYDENMGFVLAAGGYNYLDRLFYVPENAKYARLSVSCGAGKTQEVTGYKENLWKTITVNTGGFLDGSFRPDLTSDRHIIVEVKEGEILGLGSAVEKRAIWGIAYLDESGSVVSHPNFNASGKDVLTVPAGVKSVAISANVINLDYCVTNYLRVIGSSTIEVSEAEEKAAAYNILMGEAE